MHIEIEATNRTLSFDGQGAPSILHAGLGAGFDLPYECATGTCGSCRARVLEGDIERLWPEAPGLNTDRQREEVLLCQTRVRADCRLALDSAVYRRDPGVARPERVDGLIVDRQTVARDTIDIGVQLSRSLTFRPGQFFNLGMADVAGRRAYSAVNHAAGETDLLRFIIRRKPGGAMSERLFDGEPVGVSMDILGPYGRATFHPSERKNILCIAGGSGLAGMLSILEAATEEGYFGQFSGTVFFGVRRLADAFMLERLNAMAQACGERLSITVALSDETISAGAAKQYSHLSWAQGMVHEAVTTSAASAKRNLLAFVAGPPPAVEASLRLLLKAGLAAQDIRYDKFS